MGLLTRGDHFFSSAVDADDGEPDRLLKGPFPAGGSRIGLFEFVDVSTFDAELRLIGSDSVASVF